MARSFPVLLGHFQIALAMSDGKSVKTVLKVATVQLEHLFLRNAQEEHTLMKLKQR